MFLRNSLYSVGVLYALHRGIYHVTNIPQSKSQPPLHKIATGGTKSSPGTSTSSNSRDKSAVSDKKQTSSSSNSKTIIKRMEVSDIVMDGGRGASVVSFISYNID